MSAVDHFVRVHSGDGSFDLGNAYAHLKRWPDAADSHRAALATRPDFPEARQNLAAVLDVIKRIDQAEKDKEQEQGVNVKPDEVKEDDKTKKGKSTQSKQQKPETATDVWLRRQLCWHPPGICRLSSAARRYHGATDGSDDRVGR